MRADQTNSTRISTTQHPVGTPIMIGNERFVITEVGVQDSVLEREPRVKQPNRSQRRYEKKRRRA